MTLPLDLLIHFALGASVGFFARSVHGASGALISRFLVALLCALALLFTPLALVRFHFWNDWTYLYLLSPLRHSAMAELPAEAAMVSLLFLSSIAGYRAALRARAKLHAALAIAVPAAMTALLAALLSDRVFSITDFDSFARGEASSLLDRPWAFVMFSCETAAVIATIAVARRLSLAKTSVAAAA